jgi:hypothetical protein
VVYVFGMSHAINILKAASATPLSFTHENWSSLMSDGCFFDIPTHPGLLREKLLKAFIASPGIGWGLVADFRTTAEGHPHVVAVNGYVQLLRSIEVSQDGNTLVSVVHGNEHSGISLLQHPVPYDFVTPDNANTALIPGAQPLAYAIVRSQMKLALNPTVAVLAMARIVLPRIRLLHVLPPPPIASEERIKETPEVFREQLLRIGISPLALRVKYHRLCIDVLRSELAPFRVELLEPPASATTEAGAIRDEFAYGATHANEAYGALVMQQIASLVG